MAKFTPKNLLSGFADVDSLNENFASLEALSDTWLTRQGTSPNSMEFFLDMNSHDILNIGTLFADDIFIDGDSLAFQVALARDWAVKTDDIVDFDDYSSKAYAVGIIAPAGSAKDWATKPTDELVDGNGFSALHWASKAQVAFTESTATEEIVLTSGQIVATFTEFELAGSAFYITGPNADNGKLSLTNDYSITDLKEITLVNSYPAGTILSAIQPFVQSFGGSASEEVILTSGQVVVDYTTFAAAGSGFYITGPNADNGRIASPSDYIISDDKQITLTNSYPAGTIIKAVKTETGETGAADAAAVSADEAEASAIEAALSAAEAATTAADINSQVTQTDIVSINATLLNKQIVAADTSSGVITLLLPASPDNTFSVLITDYADTWAANNVVVARNGANIKGLAADMNLNVSGAAVEFTWVDATRGWIFK